MIAIYILLFTFGAALTSFFNAQIYRLENSLPYPDFITKVSYCEKCKKRLKWYELIPIVSYVFQKGRCSECGYRVPLSYPIFEALLGLSYVVLFHMGGGILDFTIVSMLFFLALYDFYYRGIPQFIMHLYLLSGIVCVVVSYIFQLEGYEPYSSLLSVLVAVAVLILNRFKESFGVGDLLVLIFLSFFYPLQQLVAVVFFSIIIGGFASLFLLISGRVKRKSKIPFIPFIFLGLLAAYLLEEQVAAYFTNLAYLW